MNRRAVIIGAAVFAAAARAAGEFTARMSDADVRAKVQE